MLLCCKRMTSLHHQLSGPSEVIWRWSQLTPLFREQRPYFSHAWSSKLTVTGHCQYPAVCDARLSNRMSLPGSYEISARTPTQLAANEVNERILRLNISRRGVRRQKIDHSDQPETTEGQHADHDTDDIGPDQR